MSTGNLYIDGYYYLSIQPTFEEDFDFDSDQFVHYSDRPIPIIDPNYKDIIPPLQLRRMNKSMRMSMFCGQKAMKMADVETVDAIIVGTGLGCLQDSEKFVINLLDDELQVMNPTPFIQSTHNMAAATLAIAVGCTGYNMTYVDGANSFESALIDSQLYLSEHPDQKTLVGGVDEIGIMTPKFWETIGLCNTENPQIPTSPQSGKGEIDAEGAAFFVMSGAKSTSSIAKIEAISTSSQIESGQFEKWILDFLESEQIATNEIDLIMMGFNGDKEFDQTYQIVAEKVFEESQQRILGYKHVTGEFDTVVSLGLAMATQILETQIIPARLLLSKTVSAGLNSEKNIQRILLIQHRRHESASLIVLKNESKETNKNEVVF